MLLGLVVLTGVHFGSVLVTLSRRLRWVLVTPAGDFYLFFWLNACLSRSRITADLLSALVRSSNNSGSWFRLIFKPTLITFSASQVILLFGSGIDFNHLSWYTFFASQGSW